MKEGIPIHVFPHAEGDLPTKSLVQDGSYKYVHLVGKSTIAFARVFPLDSGIEELLEHGQIAAVLPGGFSPTEDDAGDFSVSWPWPRAKVDQKVREMGKQSDVMKQRGLVFDPDQYKKQLEQRFGSLRIAFYVDATSRTLRYFEPNPVAKQATKELLKKLFPQATFQDKSWSGK